MNKLSGTMAEQIATAASAFEQQRTGLKPKAVSVILTGSTLVITLQGALSEAEKALAQSSSGAAQVLELHRQLFANGSASLCRDIVRITGVALGGVSAQMEPQAGAIIEIFATGTLVQVYELAQSVPTEAWSHAGVDGVGGEKDAE